jgi:hypothetical protein
MKPAVLRSNPVPWAPLAGPCGFFISTLLLATLVQAAVQFSNPSPGAGDAFGISQCAVGNTRVLIGAYRDDTTGAMDAGAAYLFDTNGSLLGTYTNPVPVTGGVFGSSVATVGTNTILIGAPGNSIGGAAYLFSAGGALITAFTNPFPEPNGDFGISVAALGNDRVVIADWLDDAGGNNAGAFHVFNTNGLLLASGRGLQESGTLGSGIAVVGSRMVVGSRILIGAPNFDVNLVAGKPGAAFLFNTNGVLLTTITNPTPAGNERFGDAVAVLDDDRILINAPGESGTGGAYLFTTSGTLLTTFTNPTPVSGDNFGWSMSGIAGRWVLIGAPLDNGGGVGSGAAYLFNTNGVLLYMFAKPSVGVTDFFGHAVTWIGENRVLISAQGDDAGATNTGAAYLFEMPYPTLMITFESQAVSIQWSGDETNLVLQASAILGDGAMWNDVNDSVLILGNTYQVHQALTPTNRFYRLSRPWP